MEWLELFYINAYKRVSRNNRIHVAFKKNETIRIEIGEIKFHRALLSKKAKLHHAASHIRR